MTFFDELGLKAAEQLEASVGPYVALASYKRLFAADGEIRSKAAIGALRCAIALEDDRELAEAADALASAPSPAVSAVPLIVQLLHGGRREQAARLARVERDRTSSALAAYVHARATDEHGADDASACERWHDVASRAVDAGDGAVLGPAVSRLVEAWLARVRKDEAATLPRARLALLCEKASLKGTSGEQSLLILRGRLLSGSNFQRASALSAVEEIARTSTGDLREMAIDTAVRHFDQMPLHLHAIEIDRVRATLKQVTPAAVRDEALAHLEASVQLIASFARREEDRDQPLDRGLDELARSSDLARSALARVRAAAHGGEGGGGSLSPSAPAFDRLATLAVGAIVALHQNLGQDARAALDRARELLSPDLPVPTVAWAAARLAIDGSEGSTRAAGVSFVCAAIGRTTSLPPPPLTGLANSLSRAGANEGAAMVLEEAARFRESEALAALADTKRRVAYQALSRGDRGAALAALREARELFQRA